MAAFWLRNKIILESNEFSKNYLLFIIDKKTYAVPILSLVGVIGTSKIVPVADKNISLVGTFNTENFIIPIIDLRLVMNKPDIMNPNKTCVLIACIEVDGQGKLAGFIVDSLAGVHHLPLTKIEKLSVYNQNEYITAVANIDEKLIMILSLEKIINKKEIISFLDEFQDFEDRLS